MRRTPKLGQHFLSGLWAAAKLVESAKITAQDTVVEIGPGYGALTKELLETGATVLAIEKDEALAEELERAFATEISAGRFRLIAGDVRDFDPEAAGLSARGYILAANIPYYITGEILRQFLSAHAQPKRLALLIQKEVAERILARNGKESILSISVKVFGTPSIAAKVSKGNFSPPPSVDSAILVVDDISKGKLRGIDEEFFFSLVRAGFSSKRKKLSSNLSGFGKLAVGEAFAEIGIGENARAEDIPLETWLALAAAIGERTA